MRTPCGELCDLILRAQSRQISRLVSKTQKGWSGWDQHHYRDSMCKALLKNAHQGQWIDVMNFAMFLWHLDGMKKK